MINEIYQLTKALEMADITAEHIHPKYKPIPKVTKKAPCVQLILKEGQLYKIRSISEEQAAEIRKYGTNQGTFPALNLAPLYRLTEKAEIKWISELTDGKSTEINMEKIRGLCRENNWGKKFQNKYRISMQEVPREMEGLFLRAGIEFLPLKHLIEDTGAFADADNLHQALEDMVFTLLEQKIEIRLALQILFYLGKEGKKAEDDYGTLSVVMDSRKLMDDGLSTATVNFTDALNRKLIESDETVEKACEKLEVDAFGNTFAPLEEPMPTVKLTAGFEVSLRTMFRGQPCQSRYGRIENATYPISKEMRFKLQAALAWMSAEERKGITWISIDKDEALFAYPETLRKNMYSLVGICKRSEISENKTEKDEVEKNRNEVRFGSAAQAFVEEIRKTKKPGTDPMSERIQYLVLRKLDKARTKVVYAYNITPKEIEQRSEQWTVGCRNIPTFKFGKTRELFPVEVSDILNQIWRQDGKPATDKHKLFPRYHGVQLLFEGKNAILRRDLSVLTGNTANLALYLGRSGLSRRPYDDSEYVILQQTLKTLALLGLFLYQLGIRKEKYMKEFPYLLGQMLKISDELHALYCKVERNSEAPNVLAGSGVYIMGAEQPYKALDLLGKRMSPYIAWARKYAIEDVEIKDKESWRAKWCLSLYEDIAAQLDKAENNHVPFNDEEKAQYFIGYVANYQNVKNQEALKQERTEDVQEEKQ